MPQVLHLTLPDHLQQFMEESILQQNGAATAEEFLCQLVQREFEERQYQRVMAELTENHNTPDSQAIPFDLQSIVSKAKREFLHNPV